MINQISQVVNYAPIRKSLALFPVMLFLFSGSLFAVLIFFILGYQIFYLDRVYPGVTIAGIDVGGMNRAEIEQIIASKADEYLYEPITIRIGSETHTFTKQDLGLQVDIPGTADKAYQIGRRGNLLDDLPTHLSLLRSPQNIQPVILYDTGPSHQVLHSLIDLSNYPPKNAKILVNSATDVELVSAEYGQRLHVDATRPLIEAAIFSDDKHPVNAVVQKVRPDLTDEDVLSTYAQIKRVLADPLVFGYKVESNTARWHLEPKTVLPMIDWVEWVDTDGKLKVRMELNEEKLVPYFEEFAKTIDREAVDGKLLFDDEAGELVVVQESEAGRVLDVEAAVAKTVEAVENGSNTVELPVRVVPAAVSTKDVEALGIKEKIAESTSYFSGSSEGRMRNIELSASKFNGVVIPPDEIFSFNRYLGPVTKEEGYDESLIISGNRTTVGIGGGVCQVSTTAFRTAFFGGFEIVERWAHGYRVGWYEINSKIGLDATIYAPSVDFKFRNDTGHHILIQTETDLEAGTTTFKFYGTPTDREVTISEPVVTDVVRHDPPVYEQDPSLPEGFIKQVDWAKDGMDVSVTRVVKEGDKVLYRDELVSRYKPWQAVYKVGARRTQQPPRIPSTAPIARQ